MENKNTVSLFQILRNSYPRVICCNAVFFSSIHFFLINVKNQLSGYLKIVWICIWCLSFTSLIRVAGFMHTQAEFITMAVFHKLKSVVVLI